MRQLLTLTMTMLIAAAMHAESAIEYFTVGNPVNYCGTDYYFAWSSHPQDNYWLQEYLPKGETSDHFDQMFTVSVMLWDMTAEECINAKIAELNQRKEHDPVINYLVFENDGEYMLEFVVSDSNEGKINTVELDLHYYRETTINGEKATILEFYSHRVYGDDILPFLKSIPEKRGEWLEGMINHRLTPIFPK